MYVIQDEGQFALCLTEYLSRFTSLGRSHNSGFLQLIHQPAGSVVADAELTLNHAAAAALLHYYHLGYFVEHRIQVVQVHIRSVASVITLQGDFRQWEGAVVTLLAGNIAGYVLYLIPYSSIIGSKTMKKC